MAEVRVFDRTAGVELRRVEGLGPCIPAPGQYVERDGVLRLAWDTKGHRVEVYYRWSPLYPRLVSHP